MMSTITKEKALAQSKVDSVTEKESITKVVNKVYRIFLVDDDPMVLKLLKRYISEFEEYQITTFSTGEDCINALAQKPDIVVLDHNLADESNPNAKLDGLDVLKEIKNQNPETQVIMPSAQVEVEIAVACLKKGAVNYIVKDGVMQFSIKEAMDTIVNNEELKEEIHELSNTIKRDKLLIRGYAILTLVLCLVLFYYWSS